MARALLRLSAKLLLATGLLYLVFFAKVGAFTLYDHSRRIVATPEAQELGAGLSTTAGDIVSVLGDGLGAEDPAPGH